VTGFSDPAELARAFVDRINDHDVDGLVGMMTDDHVFTDALGAETVGRPALREAWRSYFAAFPDYRITVTGIEERGETALVTGRARASFAGDAAEQGPWETAGSWLAVIREGRVAAWQVQVQRD
jgi:ketosteroid isomerase-like protein